MLKFILIFSIEKNIHTLHSTSVSVPWTEQTKRIAIKLIIALLLLILIVSVICTARDLYINYRIYEYTLHEKEKHQQQLQNIKNELEYNTECIEKFSEDIDFAKNIAREKIKVSEDGEIVFHFEQN